MPYALSPLTVLSGPFVYVYSKCFFHEWVGLLFCLFSHGCCAFNCPHECSQLPENFQNGTLCGSLDTELCSVTAAILGSHFMVG